jgi:hypothetical protein
LVFENGAIAQNQALNGNGGGVINAGALTLRNSTLYGNITTQLNPPHSSESDSARKPVTGGSIYNTGRLILQSCTLCRNQADGEGGGLDNRGEATLSNCIVAENVSFKTTAGDVSGTFVSEGHNLIQNGFGWSAAGDLSSLLVGQDPHLGPFGYHGGETETVPLLPASPAIDAGDCSSSPGVDQRGARRAIGFSCDLGAFEFQPGTLIVRDPSGMIRLQVELQPDEVYFVETSVDLVDWQAFPGQASVVDGVLHFIDAGADQRPGRFYRVRSAYLSEQE